jgi:hypothetical protein
MSKKIYLIAGHGTEELVEFTKREKVPSGRIIVCFPICGRANFMRECCRITHIMNLPEYAELLSNPIDNKNAIEKLFTIPIRIYIPNDFFPKLSTNLFLNFEKRGGIVLAKSGVYSLAKIPPIDRTILPNTKTVSQKLGTTFCVPFTGLIDAPSDYTQEIHTELFRGNLFEPALAEYDNLKNRSFTITQIIDTIGNGIYYYVGCRSLKRKYDMVIYNTIFNMSDSQQQNSDRLMPVLED